VSISKRGARSYLVRVEPYPARTLRTKEDAERVELELKRRKALGEHFQAAPITLGEAMDGTLARLRATGNPSASWMALNELAARAWEPLRAHRVSALRRAQIEDMTQERAAVHRKSAKVELEFLKRVLREAKARGQRVDPAIFEIPAVKHKPRQGRALSVSQLYEFASWFPEHVSRMILVAGMVGPRQRVWFSLTDGMLDRKARTMTIPASLAKSRREHCIYFNDLEATLIREQLLARTPGTSLVFPTLEGKAWTANRFRDRVWLQAVEAAKKNDPERRNGAASVYDGFTFHMLRHTAASLMALAGFDPAAAAERLEHNDGGALFLRTYRHLYEGEKRQNANRLQALIRDELDENSTEDGEEAREGLNQAASEDGRYWARTSDPQLVELVLWRRRAFPLPYFPCTGDISTDTQCVRFAMRDRTFVRLLCVARLPISPPHLRRALDETHPVQNRPHG
jgi:integrase